MKTENHLLSGLWTSTPKHPSSSFLPYLFFWKSPKGYFQSKLILDPLQVSKILKERTLPLFSLLVFGSMPDTCLTNWDGTKDCHSLISLTTLLPGSRWKFVCESPTKIPRVNVHSPCDLIVHKPFYSSSRSPVGKDFNTKGLRWIEIAKLYP